MSLPRLAGGCARTLGVRTASAAALGLIGLALVSGCGGGGGRETQETAPGTTTSAAPSPGRIYWGAWIGKQFTGTEAPFDMQAVSRFQSLVGGKGLSLIEFSSPFANCYRSPCVPYPFSTRAFDAVREYGAIPLFSWGSNAIPIKTTASRYSLRTIIAGDHDAYIRDWANAARGWGHPFFLRFDWEMNGRWFPWGWDGNGNRPGEFVRAWRHVHRIFTSAGATNVTWVWCPNVDPGGVFGPLRALYPGSAYVDWTCADAYNRNEPWTSFDDLFGATYDAIAKLAPAKPMMLGEIGSTSHGGSKAEWIHDLLLDLSSRYPLVRGVAYFEKYASGFDWPIETSKASVRAFSRGIAPSTYVENELGTLSGGRIQPPG